MLFYFTYMYTCMPNEYDNYFKYLNVFSPFSPTAVTNWISLEEDSPAVVQKKEDLRCLTCAVCGKALFFCGYLIWNENGIRARLDNLGRPHIIIYSSIHDEHQPATISWNPTLLVKMSKCVESIVQKYDIKNFSVEYRHGDWNTHNKIVYWRLMMGAPFFVETFSIKNRRAWWGNV